MILATQKLLNSLIGIRPIRLHRMYEMQTFVRGVCLSVCHAAEVGSVACSVRRTLCARGYSMQPSVNLL